MYVPTLVCIYVCIHNYYVFYDYYLCRWKTHPDWVQWVCNNIDNIVVVVQIVMFVIGTVY